MSITYMLCPARLDVDLYSIILSQSEALLQATQIVEFDWSPFFTSIGVVISEVGSKTEFRRRFYIWKFCHCFLNNGFPPHSICYVTLQPPKDS